MVPVTNPPVLEFSQLDVTDPYAVASFMNWLWWGDLQEGHADGQFDQMKDRIDADLQANPWKLVEWTWDLQAPRKRMAQLLWLLLQGTADEQQFHQRFTARMDCLVEDAQHCGAVLPPIKDRLVEVIEAYVQRIEADKKIGQGNWGEEFWLSPDQARYVREQLGRARPDLLERSSDFEEALDCRIRFLKRHIGLIEIPFEDPDRVYHGTRGDGGRGKPVVRVIVANRQAPLYDVGALTSGPGYEWGYSGSGPTSLAKSILADAVGGLLMEDAIVLNFRDIFLATLERWSDFSITRAEVLTWLAGQGYYDQDCRSAMTEAKIRQKQYGARLNAHLLTAAQIRALPEGHLRAQRFDLVPADFECALYVDLMQWIQQGGYAIRCSLCGQPIGCNGMAHSNRLRGRWRSGRPIYHEDCVPKADKLRKGRARRKQQENPAFMESERKRARDNRLQKS